MSGPFGSPQWMYSSGGFYPYELDNSLKFDDGDSSYLSRTPTSASNRKTFTWSGWLKFGNLVTNYIFTSGTGGGDRTLFYYSSNQLKFLQRTGGGTQYILTATPLLRDVSSWYHLVLSVDTTQATAADRVKIYINGQEVSGYSGSYPPQNTDTYINNTTIHALFAQGFSVSAVGDGYLAEVNFIDGTALDPTSFGETKEGIWIPKDPTGLTYGTNGFRLPFTETTTANGFNTVIYSGNGATQSVEGVGFQPDFVWIKNRTTTVGHTLHDSVRGNDGSKYYYLNTYSTAAETVSSDNDALFSLDADGFTVGYTNGTAFNKSSNNYVAWCWDAGTGSAASNTDGTITSTVKANQDYGFSIVSHTGTGSAGTIGHGLGATPQLIITKQRSATNPWAVNSGTLLSSGKMLFLDRTDAEAVGGSNALTGYSSTTFSVSAQGATGAVNDNGETYISYCFSNVTGYQHLGTYTGNGSTDGPTVTTGFKPAWIMVKRSSGGTSNWDILDTTRSTSNIINKRLYANLNNAEPAASDFVELLSDGFKLKNTASSQNASGSTYIYLAIADTRDALFTSDASGNGNNWDANGLQHSDVMPDTPTDGFSTYNHLATTSGFVNLSEGNLKATSAGNYWSPIGNTMYMSSGKWYWEIYVEAVGTTQMHGIVPAVRQNGRTTFTSDIYAGSYADEIGYRHQGSIYRGNGGTPVATYSTYTTGDILGFALDMDNGTLDIYKNNSAAGAQFTGLSGEYLAVSCPYSTSSKSIINFGQDSSFNANKIPQGNADGNGKGDFFYAPPSGYLALCNANLPDPAIDPNQAKNPADHFNTVLYTGNGITNTQITGVGFQPDWVWIKQRNGTASHGLFDSVRGTEKRLKSQETDAEQTSSDSVTSFDSDGFTVGTNTGVNSNGDTLVAWNWKAGGTAVSNTDGSITSSVSVNEDAGFSIATYTGTGATATVGHGLSKAPNVTIIKPRNFADNWIFTHDMVDGSDDQLYLNLNNASSSPSASFTVTQNASTIGLTSWNNVNDTGDTYIMYCFTEKDGYSKFGSYKGNGSTNGPFVYTEFRPAWIMIKRIDSTSGWSILDNIRTSMNPVIRRLQANTSDAEASSGVDIDFNSNGFKLRTTASSMNNSSGTYIYMAFAEQPFKYANAR